MTLAAAAGRRWLWTRGPGP